MQSQKEKGKRGQIKGEEMWFLEESGRLVRNKATPHLDGFLPLYELLPTQHENQKSTQSRHTTLIWLPKQSKKVNEEK